MSEYAKRCMAQLQEDAKYMMKKDPKNAHVYGEVWDVVVDVVWYGKPQTQNLFEVLD